MKNRARSYKVNLELGKRVRRLRNKLDLSQEELAEKAGIHRTYMGKIERGESNPPLHTVSKIAKALKVEMSDLF
jgi:transcriptional regulator with XRE-family HTH domain